MAMLEYYIMVMIYSIPFVRKNMLHGKSPESIKAKSPVCTFKCFKSIYRAYASERYKVVYTGGPPYNADLVSMDNQPVKLLDFLKPGRPLVLNFGSTT